MLRYVDDSSDMELVRCTFESQYLPIAGNDNLEHRKLLTDFHFSLLAPDAALTRFCESLSTRFLEFS